MTVSGPCSLPPFVEGNVYGHLVVTVDEILWSKPVLHEVVVLLQWWGDEESVTLRPADVSKYSESTEDIRSVSYSIKTNFTLFEAYLKQCQKLKLLLINYESKEVVGHVEINQLLRHITGIQYQHYFPIVTSSGTRIGDLRVDFNLSMNPVPEDTLKKEKKRSRRKCKQNSSCRADEDDKTKVLKKGSLTNYRPSENKIVKNITEAENFVNLVSPEFPKVPPNTGRSDSPDCVLLEVLEKGKKLRDAMVLTVLEDSDQDVNKELLIKLDQFDKEEISKKCLKNPKNGELVTPREQKLISDYLEGKNMKEEEEIMVLNTLHMKEQEKKTKSENSDFQKKEPCCLSQSICPHTICSDPSFLASEIKSGAPTITAKHLENEKISLFRKINCFRLVVDNLTLTSAGWKKINHTVDNKNKNGDNVPPPGATYFVECNFVEDSPRNQIQPWKSNQLRFCSRRQIENVVYFGQSSAYSLRPPYSLPNMQSELANMSCLVCWRHLNQRVPSLLGHFSLSGILDQLELENTVSLPVTSDSDSILGYIRLKIELGKDKLLFGNMLKETFPVNVQTVTNFIEEDKVLKHGDVPLDVKDLSECDTKAESDKNQIESFLPNYINIPLCTNCGKNLVLTNIRDSPDSSLCLSCSNLLGQQQRLIEPNFKISIPKDFSTKEQRYHEFLLGIDSIKGCPIFAGIEEELSCYVDYKFPVVTNGVKVELAKTETTSHVVNCEAQVKFSSVHRHSLSLPIVLPLSPLLAACSPGITLRIWLRYYKPTPRDHMVAMALLPMDQLCLMELEFDKRQQQSAITKVLELPLALVPSSVTFPYKNCQHLGVLRVTVTYSNYISAPSSVRTAELDPYHLKPRLMFKENKGNPIKRTLHTLPADHFPGSEHNDLFLEQETMRPVSLLLDKIAFPEDKVLENDLKTERLKFWTGPFGKKKNTDTKYKTHNENMLLENIEICPPHTKQLQNNTKISAEPLQNNYKSSHADFRKPILHESSHEERKEEYDILAESMEKRFNQLQSDLIKEIRQKELADNDSITKNIKTFLMNTHENGDILTPHSSSFNSSLENLPFLLGPPADFKDLQNTVACSEIKNTCSSSQSDVCSINTISGFLKEEKSESNLSGNEAFENKEKNREAAKPRTFKAKIKIDRAVNLKGIKTASNGKRGKIPPSSWVSFNVDDCYENHCGPSGLVFTGQKFSTPVIRRNYNPIWNLAWDVDLPVTYLQQVNKTLIFRVFEENLDVALGCASANLSILTSGLPCLSSWLSINDLAGACKGQLKIIITPLEDVSQYQECSVFDIDDEEFEELKERIPEDTTSIGSGNNKPASFTASLTEIFVNQDEANTYPENVTGSDIKGLEHGNNLDRDSQFTADDVISDYKNTLENNFRNEMAGLENLIQFLRVGSMNSDLSFFRASENKENMSSNPTSCPLNAEPVSRPNCDVGKCSNKKTTAETYQTSSKNCTVDKMLIDASTETIVKDEITSDPKQNYNDDILTKLIQQISMFQPPAIKITDNTCQTVMPETREMFTETTSETAVVNTTVLMKDVSTDTNIYSNNSKQTNTDITPQSHHVCDELGSVLLQHFLTCKPPAVKVTDGWSQTTIQDKASTADSSGIFLSGISSDIPPSNFSTSMELNYYNIPSEAEGNSKRLLAIDNNIRDLERFLKENLIIEDKDNFLQNHSKESSDCETLSDGMDPGNLHLKETSHSLNDVESSENCSQMLVIQRETPDGGNPLAVSDTQNLSNADELETALTRQRTFVIEAAKEETTD